MAYASLFRNRPSSSNKGRVKLSHQRERRLCDTSTTMTTTMMMLASTFVTILLLLSTTTTTPIVVVEAFQSTIIPLPTTRSLLSTTATSSSTTSTTTIFNSYNRRRRISSSSSVIIVQSSVGDGNGGGGGGDDKTNNNSLGDFLDPLRRQESDNLKRAREFMSETSLPISFDDTDGNNNNNDDDDDDDDDDDSEMVASTVVVVDDGNKDGTTSSSSSSLVGPTSRGNNSSNGISSSSTTGTTGGTTTSTTSPSTSSALFGMEGQPSSDLLARNPYLQVVSKISPSDLISKFTATADPRVQEAVRTTILGLIGSLPKLAFETTSITTGQRLASLMFQLQMTGYMFKNAEYRMSMSQSLGMTNGVMTSNRLLSGTKEQEAIQKLLDKEDDPLVSGKIKGKLKIRYGSKSAASPSHTSGASKIDGGQDNDETASGAGPSGVQEDGMEIEVDAAAYMSELREEVSKLRDELIERKEAKEDALRKDLLLYIRTLPAQELKSLTNTMSQDVLVCMKGLVQAVLAGIGDGQIGPNTVTEQSGEAMAQLCMWQLAVGYNLRELEVREEMKKNMQKILGEGSSSEGGVDLSTPGTLE